MPPKRSLLCVSRGGDSEDRPMGLTWEVEEVIGKVKRRIREPYFQMEGHSVFSVLVFVWCHFFLNPFFVLSIFCLFFSDLLSLVLYVTLFLPLLINPLVQYLDKIFPRRHLGNRPIQSRAPRYV